ncbi:processive diacylglycerol alpha-glucosyltransferase [Acholeplasma hippikon]|uniref:Glycosyltransferase, MSMEG_0565 family n=1 Tax=Acholeplasma hippikon TaxID=264636 RepID=A0A449BIY0_9MOLU|nr:glycosyltransferase family 4 protein [Acholeplasma hippikon]VEU82277.1 glycosyltransferase, MSMEG_0565 family [Acholeplasma hippikon]
MKVLLYSSNQKLKKKSGIGRAFYHQRKALDSAGVSYTLDPKDTFDVVHINSGSPKDIKRFKKKAPVLVHGHSTYQDFRRSFRLWRFIEPFFAKHLQNTYGIADLIVTPTKYSKYLIESMHVVKAPVLAISNGIDLDAYKPDVNKVKAFKERFNIKEGDKVVIGVGLLFERKGLHDFFEVARMMPDYKFIWFGHLNKILRTHFINKAIKHRPNNAIMAGYVDGDVIKGAYQCANVMFFPTYEETEGIVVLEAMASKTPIITRDIPVYYDWLQDKTHVLKGNNNQEFKSLIEYVSQNDLSEMTDNAFEVVKERTLEKVGQELKGAYQQTIETRKIKK